MVIWGTLLQRRVPKEMLGRVSSLDFFVSLVFMRSPWRWPARCRR
jgi:DHA3 family tetracycline resistance protein-like MFS transporter